VDCVGAVTYFVYIRAHMVRYRIENDVCLLDMCFFKTSHFYERFWEWFLTCFV
jgi:hypothetical protein